MLTTSLLVKIGVAACGCDRNMMWKDREAGAAREASMRTDTFSNKCGVDTLTAELYGIERCHPALQPWAVRTVTRYLVCLRDHVTFADAM